MTRLPKLGNIAFAGVLALVALFVLKSFVISTAPVPEMFSEGLTLQQAIDKAAPNDGVVLAVVTADWCGPCQGYKKDGLADERVAQWIEEHGAPAYIDFDANRVIAEQLGVKSVPTTILLHEGKVVTGASGAMSGDRLLRFLDQGLAESRRSTASADTAG